MPDPEEAEDRAPGQDVSELGGVGFLLDRVSHSLGRDFEDALSPWRLRATHLGVLSALTLETDWTQSALAAFLGVERQQMVNLLNDLESRDLVARTPVEGDRRRYAVLITPHGRSVRQQAAAAGRTHGERVFAGLTASEAAELRRLLVKLLPQGHFPGLLRLPAADRGQSRPPPGASPESRLAR